VKGGYRTSGWGLVGGIRNASFIGLGKMARRLAQNNQGLGSRGSRSEEKGNLGEKKFF